jgi:protein gp37
MSDNSKIEWTDATWNPVTGCTKVSEGCRHCYALTFAERWRGTKGHYFENGFDITLRPNKMDEPLKWKRPRKIFVNSMSDLFHKDIPESYIRQVFDVMAEANWHTYQVLTKRPERMRDFCMGWPPDGEWSQSIPKHIWLGTSVEDAKVKHRIDELRAIHAGVRFISFEPLIGDVGELNLDGIHWAIVGGESGRGARPMNEEWVRNIQRQCEEQGVAFFFKQWGGVNKAEAGRELDGRTYDEMPA